MTYWTWGFVAALATWAGTGLARRYALNKQLLDQPDARRNHSIATPRGGGIAIMVTLVGTVIALAWQRAVDQHTLALLGLAIALVGSIGWWDDHRPLSARLRLCVHALAALCLFFAGLAQGWALWLCVSGAVIAVALINIWNFMDGIDGIAAAQAVVVAAALGASTVGAWAGFSVALAGAAFGFLCWNFPRARIFMGDVGSGVLGLAMAWACMAYAAANETGGWRVLFPLAPFLVDAGLTLAGRVLRKERWWEAHSLHTYQLLARRLGTHVPVTLGFVALAAVGAGLMVFLGEVKITFILLALFAWYTTLGIIWRVLRWPAKDRVDRSME